MALRAPTRPQNESSIPLRDGGKTTPGGFEDRWSEAQEAALTLARRGELRGLSELVQQTSRELEQPDRYRLQRLLITNCFALAQQTPTSRLPVALAATAEVALTALEEEPSEPLFLNWAGVALYELWALGAAKALFEAAVRLDPDLKVATNNLAALKGRRKELRGRPEPRLHPAVGRLSARASVVAAQAAPAPGMTLSVCMIVRDEAELIGDAILSVEGVASEVVVVDTGSQDRTVEIARSLGAKVLEVPWEDSFSAARNRSLEAAQGDWILYIDADERLHRDDKDRLRRLLGERWREAFYLREHNLTGSRRSGTAYANDALRLLRNRPSYRFRGRLHEQIAPALPCDLPEKVVRCSVRLEHLGYLQEVLVPRRKADRNLRLLELEREEGRDDAFLHFNLGTTYAARDQEEEAVRHLARAWELLEQEPEGFSHPFAPALASWYVLLLIRRGQLREAVRQGEAALLRFPDHAELLLRLARARAELGEREAAIAAAERCLALGDQERQFSVSAGSSGFLARTLLGVLRLEGGEAQPAAAQLRAALAENPHYSEAAAPYIRALRTLGKTGAEALADLEDAVGDLSAPVRFMAATALAETGERELAESQYEQVLAAEPSAREAALALAELRLAAGRLPEARQALQLTETDPAAARLELLIALLGDDPRLPAAAMQALPPEERAVWERAFAKGELPRLGKESAPPLLSLLQRLLELRRFDRFEHLLPALGEAIETQRERRSALAELYLQTGFYRSAARELLTLCADRPQPNDLAGLALVALRTGFSSQAEELARQALARDRSCRRAEAVLAELGQAP